MQQMVVGPPPTALWIDSGIVVGIPPLIMVKRLSNTVSRSVQSPQSSAISAMSVSSFWEQCCLSIHLGD